MANRIRKFFGEEEGGREPEGAGRSKRPEKRRITRTEFEAWAEEVNSGIRKDRETLTREEAKLSGMTKPKVTALEGAAFATIKRVKNYFTQQAEVLKIKLRITFLEASFFQKQLDGDWLTERDRQGIEKRLRELRSEYGKITGDLLKAANKVRNPTQYYPDAK